MRYNVYMCVWQNNDWLVSIIKHKITKKKESFSRKGLARIIAKMVNIIKMCYIIITSTENEDTIAGQLMQRM